MSKQQLRADSVIDSLALLYRRIEERFPNSSLLGVCADLIVTAEKTARRARAAGRPDPTRMLVTVIGLTALSALTVAAVLAPTFGVERWFPETFSGDNSIYDLVEVLSSVALIFFGAFFYLSATGARGKRRFVFRHLHELRSFAHVIDMHQLTKDPITLSKSATRTESSPERMMTPFELARYLDYSAEMLSLTGKLAALYGERTNDPEINAAVNDVETLTAGIARKIWQKIMMLDNDVAME